jgi:hypothetical protein
MSIESEYNQNIFKQIENHKVSYDPFEFSVLFLAKEWKEIPLWGFSFDEKTVQPSIEDRFETEITNESYLSQIGLPREYNKLRLEREKITIKNNEPIIVERIYYCKKDEICLQYTLIVRTHSDPTTKLEVQLESNLSSGKAIYYLDYMDMNQLLYLECPILCDMG